MAEPDSVNNISSGKKYQESLLGKEGNIGKLDVLLSQSDNLQIDLNNPNDVSLFYVASMSGFVDLLKTFINSGFPVDSPLKTIPKAWTDSQNPVGFTGLHFAFKYHKLEAIKYLLSQGASIFIPNDQGITPLHVLFETKKEILEKQSSLEIYDQIIEIILQSNQQRSNVGDSEISNFQIACTSDKPDVIENFVLNGACIDQTVDSFSGHKGFSPLHFAVKYDCVKVAKLLLKKGANVNLLDQNNRSAMHLIDSPEIAELLLQHSAGLTSDDSIGSTPLENLFEAENFQNLLLLDFANSNIDNTDVEEYPAEDFSKSLVSENISEPVHIEIKYSDSREKESSIFNDLHEPLKKTVKIYVDVEQNEGLLKQNNNVESITDENLLNQEYLYKYCPKCNEDFSKKYPDKYCKNCKTFLRRQCKRCNKGLSTWQTITDHLNTTCVMKKHFFNCSKCSYRAKSQPKVYNHWKTKHATCDFENDGLTYKERLEKVTCRKEGITLDDLKKRSLADNNESDTPNDSVDSKKVPAKRRKKIQSESVGQENAPIVLTPKQNENL